MTDLNLLCNPLALPCIYLFSRGLCTFLEYPRASLNWQAQLLKGWKEKYIKHDTTFLRCFPGILEGWVWNLAGWGRRVSLLSWAGLELFYAFFYPRQLLSGCSQLRVSRFLHPPQGLVFAGQWHRPMGALTQLRLRQGRQQALDLGRQELQPAQPSSDKCVTYTPCLGPFTSKGQNLN